MSAEQADALAGEAYRLNDQYQLKAVSLKLDIDYLRETNEELKRHLAHVERTNQALQDLVKEMQEELAHPDFFGIYRVGEHFYDPEFGVPRAKAWVEEIGQHPEWAPVSWVWHAHTDESDPKKVTTCSYVPGTPSWKKWEELQ